MTHITMTGAPKTARSRLAGYGVTAALALGLIFMVIGAIGAAGGKANRSTGDGVDIHGR